MEYYPLKEVFYFLDCRGKSPDKRESGIPLLTAKNVKKGFINKEPKEFLAKSQYEEWIKRGIPKEGDILFTTEAPLGNVALLPKYEKVVVAQRIICLSPKLECDTKFYKWYMLGYQFQAELLKRATGSTAKGIRSKELAKIKIPLPPLPEQKKIAAILDEADQLRQLNQEVLEKYDALTQSLFLEMFGDPVTNPKGWKKVKIGDIVSEVKYGTSSKASEKGKYPYLRMNNITYQGYMDYTKLKYIDVDEKDFKKYSVQKGDILFNRTNSKELVGKSGLIISDKTMIIAGYLIRIRVNENNNPYFLWAHLNSKWAKTTLRSMCKSIVGMANINAKEVQKIKIFKTPLALQNQFADRIKTIETQKSQAQAALKESEDLFNSLLQKAFKGELTR